MSCIIMNDEPVSALADFLACLLNNGHHYFGFDAPETLKRELRVCYERGYYQEKSIFYLLSALNREAYGGRWGTDRLTVDDTTPVYSPNTKYKPVEYGPMNPADARSGYDAQVRPWHYEMVKRLDCFIYQCYEKPADETELFKALVKLRDRMTLWIVQHSPEYTAHKWGE